MDKKVLVLVILVLILAILNVYQYASKVDRKEYDRLGGVSHERKNQLQCIDKLSFMCITSLQSAVSLMPPEALNKFPKFSTAADDYIKERDRCLAQ